MRGLLVFILLAVATPALAQDEPGFFERLFRSDQAESDERQGSLLEQLLEDQLSDAGRQVTVEGFSGALTGAATLESLTISDENGVWLTLQDAELDWNRAALFQGRIEVAKLTAGEILLPRLPESGPSDEAPTPEASGFKLPELPVSIQIDEIAADRVALGAPVLGVAVDIATKGALALVEGSGDAELGIIRLDGRGSASLNARFENASDTLALDLSLEEAADGILATLLGLPGRPALAFGISGEGPLTDYTADIRLASDGQDRLRGQVSTFAVGDTIGLTTELSGDIAPLFDPQYRPFFGPSSGLSFSAFRTEGGGTVLKELNIAAEHLSLDGEAVLGADLMPRRFSVNGTIRSQDGTPVLLPFAGEETRVDAMRLDVSFDAADGDDWTGAFDIDGFSRGPITARAVDVRGVGRISDTGVNSATGSFTFDFDGLGLGDPSLQGAVGDAVQGRATFDWQSGRDLRISELSLEGETYRLSSKAVVTTGETGPEVAGTADAEVDRLAVFSGLAGRTLGGSAAASLDFQATPLAGDFGVTLKSRGQDIRVGDQRADAILTGASVFEGAVERDDEGLRLRVETLNTDHANLTGWANLTSGSSALAVSGRIEDAGLLLDGLSGSAVLDVQGTENEARDWDIQADVEGSSFDARWDGRLIDLYGNPRAEGQLEARSTDLSDFAALAARPIKGAVVLDATGSLAFDLSAFSVEVTAEGDQLGTGIPDADKLLQGRTTLSAKASGSRNTLAVSAFNLQSGTFRAEASGAIGPADSQLEISARLANVAPFVAGLEGPIGLSGTLSYAGFDRIELDLTETGPGGSQATIKGSVSETLEDVSLRIAGRLPLQLANRVLAPNSVTGPLQLNLIVNGPPTLGSVSGRMSGQGIRFAAPEAGVTLNNISLNGVISSSRLQLDVDAGVEGGGRVNTSGNVRIEAPYPADLSTTLGAVRLSDPRLFETTIDGTVRVVGPLAGGARITGAVDLGLTEIRIPTSSLGGAGAIPEIVHINEPPPVRGTRRRAGLLDSASGRASRQGPVYPIDIAINAPNRIFVRGRGLDSEFGGQLRVAGTSANILPSGGFNLVRGRLDILGRRLDLTEAQIDMRGSPIPRLNLVAATTVDEYRITVTISGPADDPDITFASSPELPQEEVLARLIFGRGVENLSALQAARLALAVRTLAGRGGEGVVARLRSGSGLADLDITTTDDGNAAVRAGAYLNENLYTDVTVDSAGETRLNLNLDVSPSLTVKGGVTSDGDSSLGIFFERDY